MGTRHPETVARPSRIRRPPRRAGRAPHAPALVISVPSQTTFLGLIREVTQKLAETAGFDAATAGKLALAVDDAATNVIEHAYRGAPDRRLELRLERQGFGMTSGAAAGASRSRRSK